MIVLLMAACSGLSTNPTAAPLPSCPPGYAWDGGECVPEACGAAPWGDAPLDPNTRFVKTDAEPGGDGSDGAPFRTIAEALEAAPGGIVRVAEGEYAEHLDLGTASSGVAIEGRCAELVRLRNDDEDATLSMRVPPGSSARVEGLTFLGGDPAVEVYGGMLYARGLIVEPTGAGLTVGSSNAGLELTASTVRGASSGIRVEDSAAATLTDVTVADTYGDTALYVATGAQVDASGVTVQDTEGYAVGVVGADAWGTAAWLSLSDSQISGTRLGSADPEGSVGLFLGDEAGARLERVEIVDTVGAGVALAISDQAEAAPALTAIDLTVSGTLEADVDDPDPANGVEVFEGTFSAVGLTIRDVDGYGLVATSGTRVAADELTLERTGGYGLVAAFGAEVDVHGGSITDATTIGAYAQDAGTRLDLTDVDVTGVTDPDHESDGGYAIGGAELTVEGGTWSAIRGNGLYIAGPDTEVHAEGLTIRDLVHADTIAGNGVGVIQLWWSRAELVDCTIDGAFLAGILAGGWTSTTLERVTVGSVESDGFMSLPLGVMAGAHGELEAIDLYVADVPGPGIVSADGDFSCTDCVVENVAFAAADVLGAESAVTLCWNPDGYDPVFCDITPARCAGLEICASDEPFGRLSLVRGSFTDVGADAYQGGGVGLFADGSWGPSLLEADGVLVDGTRLSAVYARDRAGVYVRGSELHAAEAVEVGGGLGMGNVVFATGGIGVWDPSAETGLHLGGNLLTGAGSTGAVFLDGSSVELDGNTWQGNEVDLRQQLCAQVPGAIVGEEEAPVREVCPRWDEPVLLIRSMPFFLGETG